MTPVIATTKKRDFDPTKFLTTIGEGRKIVPVALSGHLKTGQWWSGKIRPTDFRGIQGAS
jgi:hypothetical protein